MQLQKQTLLTLLALNEKELCVCVCLSSVDTYIYAQTADALTQVSLLLHKNVTQEVLDICMLSLNLMQHYHTVVSVPKNVHV